MAARVSNHGKKEYGLGLGPILGMCATQRVAVLLDLITAYCKPAAWLSFTYSEGVQIGALGEREKKLPCRESNPGRGGESAES